MGDMTDKILCPWCGAEMRGVFCYSSFNDWHGAGWYKCGTCMATGPVVKGWNSVTQAEQAGKVATLRRYTPLIKPMTFEEVERLAHSDSIDDETPLYLEDVDGDIGWEISYKLRRLCFNSKDYYGKYWRCWERKPTDEERSAAEWL